jgi:hypothetical protein
MLENRANEAKSARLAVHGLVLARENDETKPFFT